MNNKRSRRNKKKKKKKPKKKQKKPKNKNKNKHKNKTKIPLTACKELVTRRYCGEVPPLELCVVWGHFFIAITPIYTLSWSGSTF